MENVKRLGIKSIAIPPLGCGSGGLDWNIIRPMIESAFYEIPVVKVFLFEPKGAPEPAEMPVKTKEPRQSC